MKYILILNLEKSYIFKYLYLDDKLVIKTTVNYSFMIYKLYSGLAFKKEMSRGLTGL